MVPGVRNGSHDPLERRHAVAVIVWEIRTRIERLGVWGHPYRHRPTTPARQRLDGVHVNPVDVGSLFAIHFDVDEQLIHDRGRFGVFERFVGHDVAPVTSGVPD